MTVKSAAHDVDIGKNSDDLRKLERQRAEENSIGFCVNATTDALLQRAVDKEMVKSIVPVSIGCHHLVSATIIYSQLLSVTVSYHHSPSVAMSQNH